jgi:hypothetical protein
VTAARLRRRGAVLPLALALAPVAVPTVATAASECTTESGVLVVVDFGDGRVGSGCAPGDPASGLDAAAQAGFALSYNTAGMVCQVEGHPGQCPPSPPFDAYWSFWHGVPAGGWRYATVGAGQHDPAPGSVLGWRFGGGGQVAPAHPGTAPAPPPPPPPPAPQPSPTPAPQPTPAPAPSAGPSPSATPGPTTPGARQRPGGGGERPGRPAASGTGGSSEPSGPGAPSTAETGTTEGQAPGSTGPRGNDEAAGADDAAADAASASARPETVPTATADVAAGTATSATGDGVGGTAASARDTVSAPGAGDGPPAAAVVLGALALAGSALALWGRWRRRQA